MVIDAGIALRVRGPCQGLGALERVPECEADLEPGFRNLLELATASGWSEAETAIAMADMAQHHLTDLLRNARLKEQFDVLIPGRADPPAIAF